MSNINSIFLYQILNLRTIALSSEYSFLNPSFIDSEFKKGTKHDNDSIEALYNEIREGSIGIKLDNLRIASSMFWEEKYSEKGRENYYFKLCTSIAEEFFKIRNGQIYIDGNLKKLEEKYNFINKSNLEVGNKTNSKFQWYIIKQLIDIDVLIGSFLLHKNLTSSSDMVLWDTLLYTTDTLLEQVLKQGVAELHMHVGASKSFTVLWSSLMNFNTKNKNDTKLINLLKTNYNYGEVNYKKDIYLFRLIRILIALFIQNYSSGINYSFDEFIKEINDNFIYFIIKKIIQHIEDKNYTVDSDNTVKSEDIQLAIFNISNKYNIIIPNINEGNANFDYDYIEKLFSENKSTDGEREAYCTEILKRLKSSLLSTDRLVTIFKEYYDISNGNIDLKFKTENIIYPEQVLIFEALKYIKGNTNIKHRDDSFEKIFWQYIKFKNLVYKQIVQGFTSGKGLDIFTQYYGNQKSVYINNVIYESFYSQTKSQNIKKFEIRTGISDDKEKVINQLIETFEQYRAILIAGYYVVKEYKPIPLLGIIYHFIKKQEEQDENCGYDNEKESDCKNHLSKLQKKYLNQAKIICDLRRDIDKLDYYIVGVDAASKENNAEPYIFKEAFNYLRGENSIKAKGSRGGSYLKEIGFTYHVGEEFRDLLSGLRHIDETIELFNYKAGDRLGHAIALGINVDKWAEFNQVIFINAGEYLENLLWQWNLLIEENVRLEIISQLEQRIFDSVEYIFGFTEHVSIRDLYKSYYMKIMNKGCYINLSISKQKDKICKLQDYTKKKHFISLEDHKENYTEQDDEFEKTIWSSQMIYKALQCPYFRKETKKNVTLNIDNQIIAMYKIIQKIMIKKIGEKQIIIEANPTSNLIIGEFKAFEDYYITNLSSPEKEDVIVTINTDDPIIFDTRINNEYALIYDILLKEGKYSGKQVIEWLNKIRKNGLNYSFIEDRKMQIDELVSEMSSIIEQLKNYIS